MNTGEKVAYLKGLAEGIEISSDTKEGRLLTGILDVLGDIAGTLKELHEGQENLTIYAEELDEDLGVLERAIIKSGTFESDDLYDTEDNDYKDFADLEGAAKIKCDKCGELILFDLDDIEDNGSVKCPECDAEISVVGEFSSDERHCGGCRGHTQSDEQEEKIEE